MIRYSSKKTNTLNIVENKEKEKSKSNSLNLIISEIPDDNSKNQKRIKLDYNTNIALNKRDELKINEEREKIENINKISEQKKEKINFSKYLVYKIFCGKKYENIKIYEDFRAKILSEEQLFQNYFNISELKKVKQEANSYL